MTVEVALIISAVSLGFGIYQGVVSMKRNHKSDSQQTASEMTAVIVKLENISNGISEIKAEFNGVKDEVRDMRDRVIAMEQSLKSAWNRINIIEKKGGFKHDEN